MPTSRGSFDSASDADLIRAARSDPAAFEVLVKRHAGLLQRWLVAQTGDAAISHELVAETLAQAWLSARRFRGGAEDAGAAWLYGIARNLLRQHFKRGRVETAARRRLAIASSASHDDETGEVDDRIDARNLSPAVQEAFAELTPEQQQAIAYRVISDLSYREVAVQLNCTTATARKRVSRGLHALRASIAKGAQA